MANFLTEGISLSNLVMKIHKTDTFKYVVNKKALTESVG